MSSNTMLNYSDSENGCVVCFKNFDIYSIGACDHPVCFECSTRMRVICQQLECPICRQELPKVIFTKDVEPYNILKTKVERLNLQDHKHGLYFHSPSIQRRYYRLLDHECLLCKKEDCNNIFRTFQHLKEHMRNHHKLFYCDLCVKNLKIFTFERTCYKRPDLATHRRKGDIDNTSHKGHPLCKFCDTRFMDNDELYRHLRRDHLFCHFCDADGKHQYYNTYEDLRRHYYDEHYLCEEGDCKHERFTSVFRSDIDLKAHYAAVHSKNLSKSATRQARTLELEFTLAPRPRPDNNRSGRHYGSRYTERQQEEEGAVGYDTYYLEPGGPGGGFNDIKTFNNPLSAENFPTLGGESNNVGPKTISNVTITSKLNPLSHDNFPSLGNSGTPAPPRTSAVTITSYSKFAPGSAPKLNSTNYPALGDSSSSASGSIKVNLNNNMQDRSTPAKSKSPNVSIHVNHKGSGAVTTHISQNANTSTVSVRPNSVAEAFPALNSEPIPQAQWVSQKPKKQEPKASKVAPAPTLPSNSFNDFPTLTKGNGKTESKKSSVNMPVSNAWVNLNNFNSDSKSSSGKQKQEKSKDNKALTKNVKSEVKSCKSAELISQDSKNKKKKCKITNQTNNLINHLQKNNISDESNSNFEKQNGDISFEKSKVDRPNGIKKKRSELNIETLDVGEASSVSDYFEEFPSISKPPPGLPPKPPPGFNKFNLPNHTVSNDLTFTNSSGQSYSIIPSQQFYLPPNFKTRNQVLIEKFMAVLKNSDAIQQFKVYSDMFRVGEIPANKYYEHCQNFMSSEFSKIFPELLVLLPNVQKQQELYKIHKTNVKCKGLEVCSTCQQVVLKSDLRYHLSNHILDNHFPITNETSATDNVWNKK